MFRSKIVRVPSGYDLSAGGQVTEETNPFWPLPSLYLALWASGHSQICGHFCLLCWVEDKMLPGKGTRQDIPFF